MKHLLLIFQPECQINEMRKATYIHHPLRLWKLMLLVLSYLRNEKNNKLAAVTSSYTVVWQLDFEPEVGGFPFVAVVAEVAEAVYYWIQVPPLPVPLPLPLVVVAALKFQAQHNSIHQFQPLVVEDRSWCFRCHPFKDFGGLHFHLPVDIL